MLFARVSVSRNDMRRRHVAAALISLLHSIFTSFYLDVFLRRHVSGMGSSTAALNHSSREALWYFALGQILYLLWGVVKNLVVVERRHADLYHRFATRMQIWRLSRCCPTWAILFAFSWLPSGAFLMHPSVHFTLVMVLYEKLLVYCEAAWRRLPKEERKSGERSIIVAQDMVGGVGVGLASYLCAMDCARPGVGSSGADLRTFLWFTTACALVAALAFLVCGRQEPKGQQDQAQGGRDGCVETSAIGTPHGFTRFAQQTMARQSMKAAVLLWAMQGYSCTFATWFLNFFLVLCDSAVSPLLRAMLLLLAFIAPHAVADAVFPFIRKYGMKRVVRVLLLSRAVVGVVMVYVSLQCNMSAPHAGAKMSSMHFALLLIGNRLLTDTLRRMQELILCDLTHEDFVIFSRPYPMTCAIQHLLVMFFTPFQGLALVLTCLFLARMQVTNLGCGLGDVAWIAGGTVLSTSLLMLWGWQRYYNLDGLHLQFVQMAVRKRADTDAGVV